MVEHEKIAFLKFFITYFISVAILILASGYFYFVQMNEQLLKLENFSLIEYARNIKMKSTISVFSNDYHYIVVQKEYPVAISNFTITHDEFSKLVPINDNRNYLQVFKSNKNFYDDLWNLKQKVIFIQILLLTLFALISYILAKNALKPLKESISKLDKFAKDLIHDLNTPVTSIKLNMKLLEKDNYFQTNKPLQRINKSVHTISVLHENLTTLLEEETFQMQITNVCEIVEDVVSIQKLIYPNITFKNECSNLKVKLNPHATNQILQNIISNACKYNYTNGYVKIYNKENSLYIEDNGKGIQEPDKIFERSYSGEHSSGIGLDIVKRLAQAMHIKIEFNTNKSGTTFILTFI